MMMKIILNLESRDTGPIKSWFAFAVWTLRELPNFLNVLILSMDNKASTSSCSVSYVSQTKRLGLLFPESPSQCGFWFLSDNDRHT